MALQTVKFVVQLLAAGAAVISAGLWFWASSVKVPFALLSANPLGANPGVSKVISQFNLQARLNGQAAAATGFSALLAAALLIPGS